MIVTRKDQPTGKRIVGQINGITGPGPKKEIVAEVMINQNMTGSRTEVDSTAARTAKTTANPMIAEVKNVSRLIEVLMNTVNQLAGMMNTSRTIEEMINRIVRIWDDGKTTCIWSRMLDRQEVTEKVVLFAARNALMSFPMLIKNSTKRNYWTRGDCNERPLVSRVLHTSGENRLSGQMSK